MLEAVHRIDAMALPLSQTRVKWLGMQGSYLRILRHLSEAQELIRKGIGRYKIPQTRENN